MYKDKDRQREADRVRQQRRRDAVKAKGVTMEGVTDALESVATGVISARRGKDIKCFEDLPPDVQATITRISDSPEERDRRAAIAISYQHLFPDRYRYIGVPYKATA